MKKFALVAAVTALALATTASSAHSQIAAASPINFGIAAGVVLPQGDFGNAVNSGYNVTGTMAFSPPTLPVGFRFDGAYNAFSVKNSGPTAHIWSGTGNVVFKMQGVGVTPYAIGGIGFYNEGVSGGTTENHFGFNAGAGINMPLSGFSTFLEARYHRVSENGTSTSFIPITFGVMF